MNKIKPGLYEHFKGGRYEVIGLAKHSETMEDMVVYRHTGKEEMWVRPAKMFKEVVERDGKKTPRFKYIDEAK